jgi:UDP-N-acetylmuramyl pentapeptide phosphotransferase/UDP-N-acetylglucosamine-1-phosphate transferase
MVGAHSLALTDVQALLGPLLLASIPAFAAGLLEDLTKRVGVKTRLVATMASGALACWITGIALNRAGIPMVNDLLAWMPLAVLFTAFAAAGVANAINIIDGFNGLSSGAALIALAALGTIAGLEGDAPLVTLCAILAAAVAGFWLVNFPWGKLFLGDGGAYFVGFVLAWVAVLLLMRNPTVSAWTALLACGYPVIEVLYSMWRRWRNKHSPGAPDCRHLHSLIKTQLILPRFPHWNPQLRNAAVSPVIWLYAVLPAGLAVWLEGASRPVLASAFFGCVIVYHLAYRQLAKTCRSLPSTPPETAHNLRPNATGPILHSVARRKTRHRTSVVLSMKSSHTTATDTASKKRARLHKP